MSLHNSSEAPPFDEPIFFQATNDDIQSLSATSPAPEDVNGINSLAQISVKRKYKTKFPMVRIMASYLIMQIRIKKIMQLDEEIGKVAVATPAIVCIHYIDFLICLAKALEIFLQSIIDYSIEFAKKQNSPRINPYHVYASQFVLIFTENNASWKQTNLIS